LIILHEAISIFEVPEKISYLYKIMDSWIETLLILIYLNNYHI